MSCRIVFTTPPVNCKLDMENSHRTVAEFKEKREPGLLSEDSLYGTCKLAGVKDTGLPSSVSSFSK